MMQGCKLSSQDQTHNSPAAFLFPELTERLDDYTRTSTLMVVHVAVDEMIGWISHEAVRQSVEDAGAFPSIVFFLFPVFLPSAWRKPGASYRPGMWSGGGGEENANPVLLRLNHLSGFQSGGRDVWTLCMEAGKSHTIRLPAVILRVIVSGERQECILCVPSCLAQWPVVQLGSFQVF